MGVEKMSINDVKEHKTPEQNNFRDIKPQNNLTPNEARNHLNEKYKSNEAKENVNKLEKEKDAREDGEVSGGSYRDVKKGSDGKTEEVHHMPADCASDLSRDDGPCIKMDKQDHRQTASCGNSKEAREYQNKQKELISQGKFREALNMDVKDIQSKFGNKYDKAIGEMLKYVDKLEQEGKING